MTKRRIGGSAFLNMNLTKLPLLQSVDLALVVLKFGVATLLWTGRIHRKSLTKQQCQRYSFIFIFFIVDINLHYVLLTSLTGTGVA